ncbi:MAG TPA: LysR family transcriptional regulator [Polyangiaceae bacterium LLY-WYZ-15_(1-7)]|nr:hypothetical protein [Myxococcales bacterium]MAT26689.1 hypothetical protein [Sandaracinus sp.]HJK89793.1 LysR family transcriptional regulator [Polyangiaceae bacterium LLY-WYZ-15_(1-7)]MBJ69794.1 hypothetical protein [Sandaracinus sp.]HJL02233.1 LysR family transcriptional regulator [Polyangiaceae bacterium LLY-WYZ-15_(1-7)]
MTDAPDDLLDHALAQLLAVVEHGSFSAAAKALGLSQPTLSVAVRKLEERLDTPLLHRGPRGVTPTEAGALLVQGARQARRELAAALDEVDALQADPRGTFRLGVHESLGTYFLPGFMGRFLARHPRIALDLHNANSRAIEEAIVQRELDLGLVVNPARHADTVVRDLFRDAVVFVVARRLQRKADPAALLRERPVLMVPALAQTRQLLGALEGPAPRTLACQSMELVKSLVLDGVGVGVLPWRVATHGVAKGRLALLDPALPRYDDVIALQWRADTPMTRGRRVLLDALRGHGEAMPALETLLGE